MENISLICLSASSGIPLFIRHTGEADVPPFTLIASLNGIHVFGEAQGVSLLSTHTPTSVVLWKTYHDCIRLILIREENNYNEKHNALLLDMVFSVLILFIGLDALTSVSSIERLKREIKMCYPVIDELLERSVGNGKLGLSHIVHCADCIILPENSNIQLELEKYIESGESTYGCLLMSGLIVAATRNFWSLSNTELVLLPILTECNKNATARDIPVYLPDKSPNVPFRMLIICLTTDFFFVTLCGPTPTLNDVITSVKLFWGPQFSNLESLKNIFPWNMSSSLLNSLDQNIISLLLVNYVLKRSVSCFHLNEEECKNMSVSKKMSILRSFYCTCVGSLIQQPAMPPDNLPCSQLSSEHIPSETYMSSDEYKIYLLQSSPYHLIILTPPSLPVFILRKVAHRTLQLFIKSKQLRI